MYTTEYMIVPQISFPSYSPTGGKDKLLPSLNPEFFLVRQLCFGAIFAYESKHLNQ
jgi:hypothetical protein